MTRLYIAGPMSGLPDFNYPAFHTAATMLRGLGYQVENPAENDRPLTDPWQVFLRDAITKLMRCDGVALLPDHHRSRGARLEESIATRLGIPVRTIQTWENRGREAREQGAAPWTPGATTLVDADLSRTRAVQRGIERLARALHEVGCPFSGEDIPCPHKPTAPTSGDMLTATLAYEHLHAWSAQQTEMFLAAAG